ncbi:MAG TPA: hypothetical protein VG488_11120 [Candidatus Angelobacter sp.]|jgi:hypothetical protein|nr:hypothetical protein [Candidatus Angelobacter sp.]
MRNKGIRYLSSLVLMGSLAVPLGLLAQDRDDHHDRDDRGKHQRVYDRGHKDYHEWNDNENRNYRQWHSETRHDREYREYNRLNRKDRDEYWNWRHKHGDKDDRH